MNAKLNSEMNKIKKHDLKRYRTTSFAIILFFLFFAQSIAQTRVDSSRIIRVLTFNIYHGETVNATKKFDLDLLAKVITDVNPDLVALQEVDNKTNRAKKYDLVTELGWRTKMAPLFGKAMSFDDGEYGEGILSKHSFLSTKKYKLPARNGKEPRAALAVNIVIKSGDTIRFVGTHLDHTKEETDRINQAKALNGLFLKDSIPTILAGDLNATPESETMQILFKQWTPSIKENIPTAPAHTPKAKIDYVLFSPKNQWEVIETKVICNDIVTDHCAVLSVLELKKQ